jgi:TRAP transporter TAXI family solute receptor
MAFKINLLRCWGETLKLSRRGILAGALALPASARAAAVPAVTWPSALLMATGRPGGAYEIYGPAWGRLAAQSAGVAIAYRASGGAVSDILFIEEGSAQLGMTTVTVADQARDGNAAWTAGVRFESFRALFPMFPSVLQIVAPAAGAARMATIASLAGRTVGIGPDGGSAATTVQSILAAIGVIPGRFVTGDFSLQMQDMLAGRLDACAFISAPPTPAITGAAEKNRLNLIGFTRDEALHIARTTPGLAPMTIPENTFPGQSVAIASIGTPNFAIGAKSLPDSLVNAVTLAAMRNRAAFARLIPAAGMSPQPLLAMPGQMTFHPGAALALRSLGLTVPADLVEG